MKRGRPCKYLLKDEWEKFKNNDWYHANLKWKATLWLVATMWAVIITMFIMNIFKVYL